MSVRPPRFRQRRLSLTSLIDVIFLLLLFFMLSSTFSRYGAVSLQAGLPGGALDAATVPPLFLRLDGDRLSLNAASLGIDDLPQTIAAQSAQGRPQPVILSVTGRSTAQGLVDVLAPLAHMPSLLVTVLE
jgi:biopolymer transport protein ExbD